MATKQTVLTQEGLKALEDELEELKTVKRKDVAEKIKVALAFGDLSENSEYDEAKNEQGIIEARIAEIEATLMNVQVLDADNLSTETIQIGNKITVKDIEANEILVLHVQHRQLAPVDGVGVHDDQTCLRLPEDLREPDSLRHAAADEV